mmetsp:Transcript_81229/g.173860  ORF Transcript_81229/g.173860 Transcript_81229/m.173860 type:complete len:237 (-) Transcript_81229:77-787(-)
MSPSLAMTKRRCHPGTLRSASAYAECLALGTTSAPLWCGEVWPSSGVSPRPSAEGTSSTTMRQRHILSATPRPRSSAAASAAQPAYGWSSERSCAGGPRPFGNWRKPHGPRRRWKQSLRLPQPPSRVAETTPRPRLHGASASRLWRGSCGEKRRWAWSCTAASRKWRRSCRDGCMPMTTQLMPSWLHCGQLLRQPQGLVRPVRSRPSGQSTKPGPHKPSLIWAAHTLALRRSMRRV